MVKLAKHTDCTGCMACYASCKVGAISVERDKLGFVYPKINNNLCVDCGSCLKICPSINKTDINKTNAIGCYAAKIQNTELTKGCTSGGFATACAKYVVELGGVVYGAASVGGEKVKHIRLTSIEDLDLIKGSKYVESDMCEIYPLIEQDLLDGLQVLFIGTPCQVSGIAQRFKSDSLLTISFICGGVPSQKYLKLYLEESKVNIESITKLVFRKGRDYCIEALNGSKIIFSAYREHNDYIKTFDIGYSVRPSCLRCDYCSPLRVGDITIGNFWGIEETSCAIRNLSNLSCLIITSLKGQSMIESLKNLVIEKVSLDEIARRNYRLKTIRSGKWLKEQEWLFHLLFPIFGFTNGVKITNFLIRVYRKMYKCFRSEK